MALDVQIEKINGTTLGIISDSRVRMTESNIQNGRNVPALVRSHCPSVCGCAGSGYGLLMCP